MIRRRFSEAAALYAAAVEIEPESKGSHESTLAQARRLMDKLSPSDAERAAIEAASARTPLRQPHMSNASATSIDPPIARIGQPLACASAACRFAASTSE